MVEYKWVMTLHYLWDVITHLCVLKSMLAAPISFGTRGPWQTYKFKEGEKDIFQIENCFIVF